MANTDIYQRKIMETQAKANELYYSTRIISTERTYPNPVDNTVIPTEGQLFPRGDKQDIE